MQLQLIGFQEEDLEWMEQNGSDFDITYSVGESDSSAPTIRMDEGFHDSRKFEKFMKGHEGSHYYIPLKFNLSSLLHQISKKEQKPSVPMPPELMEKFYTTTYKEFSLLNEIIESITEETKQEKTKLFKDEVHKIAGSSGAFGYEQMTLLSRNAEKELNSHLEKIEDASLEELNRTFLHYQKNLKLAFQNLLSI